MICAGLGHIVWKRREFQAQVPDWTTANVPLSKDDVVLVSGGVEVMLGAALLVLPKERRRIGVLLAGFYAAVFPGNLHQYQTHQDAFGLDTDRKRLVRLFAQPALMAWALWSTGPHLKRGSAGV